MMRRRASSARVPKALRAASVQNYVVLSSDAAISRSTMIAGAVIALLGLIAGFLVLSRGPLPVVQLDTPRRELVIGKGLNPNHDVPSVLKRAEKYLQLVDDWVYSPISDADAARKYLRDHPRMSKHVSAFTQAAFQALPVPSEELTYSYIVCSAGGPLAFDFFAGSVNVSLMVNTDLDTLTRTFTYETSMRSVPDSDVIQACGNALIMEPPNPSMPLPYSSAFQTTLTITESWTSTLDQPSRSAPSSEGSSVKITPFEQWKPAGLQFHARLTSLRSFVPWVRLYGEDHLQMVLGNERWDELQSIQPQREEKLVGDVRAACDLASMTETTRCMYPITLFEGLDAPQPPLISTDLFLEWQEIRFLDDEDVPTEESATETQQP